MSKSVSTTTLHEKRAIERKAVISFGATVFCCIGIALGVILDFDRQTKGYLGWFVYFPVSLYALLNSISAINSFFKNRENTKLVVLLLSLPVVVCYCLFLILILLGLLNMGSYKTA